MIVFVDLVESVKLIAEDESGTIGRWRAFVAELVSNQLPRFEGRLVKSTGDGLLLDFPVVLPAVNASFDIHKLITRFNQGGREGAEMRLRISIHAADVFVDTIDVFGAGVNLAARLLELARPGETVVSTEVRDCVADDIEAVFEDLGECFLKHLSQPVRAYKLLAPGSVPALVQSPFEHLAVVAVVPFALVAGEQRHGAIGEALACDVIEGLSRLDGLQLISRLSTSPLRASTDCIADCRKYLGARFVLSGHYTANDDRVRITCSLAETESRDILWSCTREDSVAALFDPERTFATALVVDMAKAIVRREVGRTRGQPIPTLENFTLFVAGITLMHRMSHDDFARSHGLFSQLAHRLPRHSAPKAVLAKWYLMRMLQGWSSDPKRDGRIALDLAHRALDHDPDHAFALATDGYLAAHMRGDLDLAHKRCNEALQSDPQDPQVWRMAAGVYSYLGRGLDAEKSALRALSLTPLDPTRFVFELIVGAAKLARGDFGGALEWSGMSLRRNAMHVPTHRLRVISLAMADRMEEAKQAATSMLRLSPSFRIRTFLETYPGRDQTHARDYAEALRCAGVPE